jgi:hypothetical protein
VGLVVVLALLFLVLLALSFVVVRGASSKRGLDERCAELGFEPRDAVRFRGAFRTSAGYPYGDLVADRDLVVVGRRGLVHGSAIERSEILTVRSGRPNPIEFGLARIEFVLRSGAEERRFLGRADVILPALEHLGWPVE